MRAALPTICLLVAQPLAAEPQPQLVVTRRGAVLRDAPAATARAVARPLPGTWATLVREERGHLLVTLRAPEEAGCGDTGYLPADAASAFPEGVDGSREMVAVGRFLAQDPSRLPLAASLLARAVEGLDVAGLPDPAAEVLLGETAEALAEASPGEASGAPALPASLGMRPRGDPLGREARWVYDGTAFESALRHLGPDGDGAVRERAVLGLLRCRYPFPGVGLVTLMVETEDWLGLAERATLARVAGAAADRGSLASLHLGRLLLAASRADDLRALAERLRALAASLPMDAGAPVAARLRGRADLLLAMRGDGGAPFPQEAAWGAGPLPMSVSLEGELGNLALVVRGAGNGAARSFAQPVLPVPGSLRVSPDARFAAWLEVSSPTAVTPMLVSLETGAGADVSILAGARPGRDRRRGHVSAALLGFSPDGSRLGVSLRAWNDEPPAGERLAVVSTSGAALLAEASSAGSGRIRRELLASPVSASRRTSRRPPSARAARETVPRQCSGLAARGTAPPAPRPTSGAATR